jgi:hypothetical protein
MRCRRDADASRRPAYCGPLRHRFASRSRHTGDMRFARSAVVRLLSCCGRRLTSAYTGFTQEWKLIDVVEVATADFDMTVAVGREDLGRLKRTVLLVTGGLMMTRAMVSGAVAAFLVASCSPRPAEEPRPVERDRSAFGPESGSVVDSSTEYDLRSVRLKPLGAMLGDVEVLYGHPDSVGKPFVMRIRELPGTIVPPHSHPVDEHITVVQGTWHFGLGETFDSTALQALPAGSYAFAPAGSSMFAYSSELAVVQVHGVGPFHIHWREAVQTLSESASELAFRYRIGQRVRTPRGSGEIRQGYRSGAIIQYEILGDSVPLFMAKEAEVRLINGQ